MGLFDNIPDWNNNGRHDAGDAYLDYMITRQVLGISPDETENPEENDSDPQNAE